MRASEPMQEVRSEGSSLGLDVQIPARRGDHPPATLACARHSQFAKERRLSLRGQLADLIEQNGLGVSPVTSIVDRVEDLALEKPRRHGSAVKGLERRPCVDGVR